MSVPLGPLAWLLLDGGRRSFADETHQTGDATVNYTHYDYLELPPGAAPARIEAAYAKLTARFEEAAGEQDFAASCASFTRPMKCFATTRHARPTTRRWRMRRRAP